MDDVSEIFGDDEEFKKKCINYVNYFVNFWNNRIYSFSNLPYDSFKKPKRTKTYNKNLIRDMKIVFSDDEDKDGDTEDEYDNASTISLDDDEYNSEYDSEYDSEYIPYDYDTYEMENNQDSDYYD